jgi:hypothetical protein
VEKRCAGFEAKDFRADADIVGFEDTNDPISVTDQLVDETCSAFPQSQIEYMRVAGVGDMEGLYATTQ